MTQLYRWEDDCKLLTIYSRESNKPLWTRQFESFLQAKTCADAFATLYAQGVMHGRLNATEEMRRTADHIDRGPVWNCKAD